MNIVEHHKGHHHDHTHDSAVSSVSIVSEGTLDLDEVINMIIFVYMLFWFFVLIIVWDNCLYGNPRSFSNPFGLNSKPPSHLEIIKYTMLVSSLVLEAYNSLFQTPQPPLHKLFLENVIVVFEFAKVQSDVLA